MTAVHTKSESGKLIIMTLEKLLEASQKISCKVMWKQLLKNSEFPLAK